MSGEPHPSWCHRKSCTAFDVELDRRYHRSKPVVISTDDPGIMIYVHRGAALRPLVQQAPAPVIATGLGFHRTTTTRQAVTAGAVWNRYAAGDHAPGRTAFCPDGQLVVLGRTSSGLLRVAVSLLSEREPRSAG